MHFQPFTQNNPSAETEDQRPSPPYIACIDATQAHFTHARDDLLQHHVSYESRLFTDCARAPCCYKDARPKVELKYAQWRLLLSGNIIQACARLSHILDYAASYNL